MFSHSLLLSCSLWAQVSIARPRSKAITNANLYVRNLPPHVDDNILMQIFSSHGPIIQARVLRNNDGTSRGIGFVHFDQHEHALHAIEVLNNVMLQGSTRPLTVKFAQKNEGEFTPYPMALPMHPHMMFAAPPHAHGHMGPASHHPHMHLPTHPRHAHAQMQSLHATHITSPQVAMALAAVGMTHDRMRKASLQEGGPYSFAGYR